MKTGIFVLSAMFLFAANAQSQELYSAYESNTQERYNQTTGECCICGGMKRVKNKDYNRKKIGSQQIITCPACKGKGKLSQTLKSLWGIALYKTYDADGGKRQPDGSIKFSYTPKRNYRKFAAYAFYITPATKKVFKIEAQYQAESKDEANREVNIFIQQMKKKYKDLVCTEAHRYPDNGKIYPGIYYYFPDKLSRLELIDNLDAKVKVSVSVENLVEIEFYSKELERKLKDEAQQVSTSDSDIDAL